MGFLARFNRPALRASSGTPGPPGPLSPFWYTDPQSGFTVGPTGSEDIALTLSAFWRGVNLIAGNVAACDCQIFQRQANGDERLTENHPVADIVGLRPNDFMDAHQFWEMVSTHVLLRGNFYARIIADQGGRGFVGQLRPIHPDLVAVTLLPSGTLQYTVRRKGGGKPELLGSEDIFHVKGLSLDGVKGVSVIRYGTQSLGVMLAAERFASQFFEGGATAALAAIHPESLGDVGLKNLHDSIARYLVGVENAFGVLALEENIKIEKLGISPEDSQLLATRQFGRQHVADWLNLPLAALGSDATATYAATRQFRQDLVDLTFRPFVERLEMAIDNQLFLAPQVYFSRFDLWEIMRGNPKEQADVDRIYVQDGVRTRNEVRRDHHWNSLAGLDDPLTPLNMRGTSGGAGSGALVDRWWAQAHVLLLDEARRLVTAERGAVQRLARQHAGDAEAWQAGLREFYDGYAPRIAERLRMPLVLSREYCGSHGLAVAKGGVSVTEEWETLAIPQLAALALCGDLPGRAGALEDEAQEATS